MSLKYPAAFVLAMLGSVGPALAQSDDDDNSDTNDRFFSRFGDDRLVDDEDDLKERKPSRWDGSLTSTTLAFRETARVSTVGGVSIENASTVDRLFTDMRAQLQGKHLGGNWGLRLDTRFRLTGSGRFQSGSVSGREGELRELYVHRQGDNTDITFGRQFVLELAAHRLDGLRFDYRSSKNFSYVGFAGLHPARGSRSFRTDYPRSAPDPAMKDQRGDRVIPPTVGLGGVYRYQKYYGAVGLVGVLPRAPDHDKAGADETVRVFATANGYWRQSPQFDVFHYVVVDAESAGGAGLTNLSLGFNYRLGPRMRVTGQLNRVDTETLSSVAQTRLEEADATPGLFQNNANVVRLASQSARLGVSVALAERRFELSTSGQVRQRPEITLSDIDNDQIQIAESQVAEMTFGIRDRRSYGGFDFGLNYSRIFSVGDNQSFHSAANVASLVAAREFWSGRGNLEIDLRYIKSADAGSTFGKGETMGNPNCKTLETCVSTATSRTISVGALAFYRWKRDWFLLGQANIGTQRLTVLDNNVVTPQPSILMITLFARAAYRF